MRIRLCSLKYVLPIKQRVVERHAMFKLPRGGIFGRWRSPRNFRVRCLWKLTIDCADSVCGAGSSIWARSRSTVIRTREREGPVLHASSSSATLSHCLGTGPRWVMFKLPPPRLHSGACGSSGAQWARRPARRRLSCVALRLKGLPPREYQYERAAFHALHGARSGPCISSRSSRRFNFAHNKGRSSKLASLLASLLIDRSLVGTCYADSTAAAGMALSRGPAVAK